MIFFVLQSGTEIFVLQSGTEIFVLQSGTEIFVVQSGTEIFVLQSGTEIFALVRYRNFCTTVGYRNVCTTVGYRNLCTTVRYRSLCTKPGAQWRNYARLPIMSRSVKPIQTSPIGRSYSSLALFSICYLMTLSVTPTTHILTACTNVIKKLSAIFPPPPAEAWCTMNS